MNIMKQRTEPLTQSDQSYSLQVPRLPQSYMRRVRIHCAVHGMTVRGFVVATLTAAMDAAKTPQIKEGK
jgi:hypothetical protein